jgi:hypothetical protein
MVSITKYFIYHITRFIGLSTSITRLDRFITLVTHMLESVTNSQLTCSESHRTFTVQLHIHKYVIHPVYPEITSKDKRVHQPSRHKAATSRPSSIFSSPNPTIHVIQVVVLMVLGVATAFFSSLVLSLQKCSAIQHLGLGGKKQYVQITY